MNDVTKEGIKSLVEVAADIAMWKQKAHDLEGERNFLRERIVELERVLLERVGAAKPDGAAG